MEVQCFGGDVEGCVGVVAQDGAACGEFAVLGVLGREFGDLDLVSGADESGVDFLKVEVEVGDGEF